MCNLLQNAYKLASEEMLNFAHERLRKNRILAEFVAKCYRDVGGIGELCSNCKLIKNIDLPSDYVFCGGSISPSVSPYHFCTCKEK